MEDPIRIQVAPRMAMSLWLGAVPPLVVGLANGGLAAALGGAFTVACPLLVVSSALAPVRAPRFFPLYFVGLFLVAVSAFEFNSAAFVVDTWSALVLAVLTMYVERPQEIDPEVLARPPRALRRSSAEPWPTPTPSLRS